MLIGTNPGISISTYPNSYEVVPFIDDFSLLLIWFDHMINCYEKQHLFRNNCCASRTTPNNTHTHTFVLQFLIININLQSLWLNSPIRSDFINIFQQLLCVFKLFFNHLECVVITVQSLICNVGHSYYAVCPCPHDLINCLKCEISLY